MNYRLISKLVGLLLVMLGVTMGLCLGFEVVAGWAPKSARALLIAMGATLTCGVVLVIIGKGSGNEVLRRESIAVVGIGWLSCGLFGALPYFFCEHSIPLARAFFESLSGFTTTGASVINDLTVYDPGILLWRSATQWLGGMGILVLFVAVLSYFKVGGKSLFEHESSAQREHITFTSIRRTSVTLWGIYTVMTGICFLGLWLQGMTPYLALNHAFTTLSTGGFSTENSSMADFSWGIQLWVIIFMIVGSLSFLLYARWAKSLKNVFRFDEPATVFLLVVLTTSGLITAARMLQDGANPFGEVLLGSTFQVTSLISTTGFASEDYATWSGFSQMLLLTVMFFGGCAGSTAGGLKINRFIAIFRILREELMRYYRPNIVLGMPETNRSGSGRRRQIMILFILAGFITGIGTILLNLFESDTSLMGCLSVVVSCLMNVGPALNEYGPTHNYSTLHDHSLVMLSLFMVVGRLEFLAAIAMFSRRFWKKY